MTTLTPAVAESVLREWALAQANITALVGDRVWGTVNLPAGYDPNSQGPGLQVNARPGTLHYSGALLQVSVQFRCWAATDWAAWQLYQALCRALDGAASDKVLRANLDVAGQALLAPQTQWPHILVAFDCLIRPEN